MGGNAMAAPLPLELAVMASLGGEVLAPLIAAFPEACHGYTADLDESSRRLTQPPLHRAISLQAPPSAVMALLDAYPAAAEALMSTTNYETAVAMPTLTAALFSYLMWYSRFAAKTERGGPGRGGGSDNAGGADPEAATKERTTSKVLYTIHFSGALPPQYPQSGNFDARNSQGVHTSCRVFWCHKSHGQNDGSI